MFFESQLTQLTLKSNKLKPGRIEKQRWNANEMEYSILKTAKLGKVIEYTYKANCWSKLMMLFEVIAGAYRLCKKKENSRNFSVVSTIRFSVYWRFVNW